MAKKKASPEEIAEHFDSLPRAAGTSEERLKATAKYFKVKPETVQKHLKFWWPGKKYLSEFRNGDPGSRIRWDRPTQELLATLNKHETVAGAAKALKTTAITLTKALERHSIIKRWVVEK